MTIKEVIEKHGDLDMSFSSYYKYVFSYENTDHHIHISIGGEDIYRSAFAHTEKLSDLAYEEILYWSVDGKSCPSMDKSQNYA